MIPEIGQFALVLALCMAVLQGFGPLAGGNGSGPGATAWRALAAPAARAQALFVAVAFGCLTWSFIDNDFSVAYVAQNSNTRLPVFYRISAVWGGHEGSILLWSLVLSVWTVAVSFFSRSLPEQFRARVLGVMGLIAVGFLLFILGTSNPFDRLIPAAAQGRDLNPLLQDPGMIVHPPLLYMGYVGLAVDFPDTGYRPGQLVGVLRTGLGGMVVLGSGGERLVHALAAGHRAHPLPGGDRAARRLPGLDGTAGHLRILPQPAGYLPGTLRGADFGARLCH